MDGNGEVGGLRLAVKVRQEMEEMAWTIVRIDGDMDIGMGESRMRQTRGWERGRWWSRRGV